MKNIITIIALMLTATNAFADPTTANIDRVTSETYSTVQNDSHDTIQGTDLSRAVGMATAPALTTTLTETCMGSTSAGAGFSGGSFSFGTTWRDTECVNRLNAREIRTYGDVQAAKEIMCNNDVVRDAFRKVGRPCADDGGIYTTAPVVAVAPVMEQAPREITGTDKPIKDDADEVAKRTQMMLDQAEESAASLRAKGF